MGRRGPVPQPDNVRDLRGMRPLKTPDGKKAERIILPPKAPAMPAGLSQAAAAEWRRVSKELARAGVLAEVDRGILTAYCLAWSHMMEAEALLKKNGIVVKSKRGDEGDVKNPAWQIWREANGKVTECATQLFITPVARLRFPVAPGSAALERGGDGDSGGAWD